MMSITLGHQIVLVAETRELLNVAIRSIHVVRWGLAKLFLVWTLIDVHASHLEGKSLLLSRHVNIPIDRNATC